MAGLLSGWLGENPFYQGFDERRNTIGQFGLGLMSGSNPQEGFQKGIAGAIDGRQRDDAYATAKRRKPNARRRSAPRPNGYAAKPPAIRSPPIWWDWWKPAR
ncbi:hypothetical protein N8D56_05040 [Devosia sp. A8/3-2]|nr:hypothetical protein N8D56_05040 [Devosia sp. A8/3-2]